MAEQPLSEEADNTTEPTDRHSWHWFIAFIGALLLGGAFLSSLGSPSGVNVATGVPAVSGEHHDAAEEIIAALKALPEGERAGYMSTRYPELGTSIIGQMRDRGKIRPDQRVESVTYRFGSMDDVVAEQAGGTRATGHFVDQLIAVVKIAGVAEPQAVIVLCSNGLLGFVEDDLAAMPSVGQQAARQMVFTIQRGEGLTTYVNYRTAIDIAARHNLPITKIVRGRRAELITPEAARGLEDQTDNVRVVVAVNVDDQINIADMTYTAAGR
jgi:hypothetical protein